MQSNNVAMEQKSGVYTEEVVRSETNRETVCQVFG